MAKNEKTTAIAPAPKRELAPIVTKEEQGAGWAEVLIPVMVDVGAIGDGEIVQGAYIGSREQETMHGTCMMHFLMTDDGPKALWGSMALDQGFAHSIVGAETRVAMVGWLELDGGKRMRQVRIAQNTNVRRQGAPQLAQLQRPAELPATASTPQNGSESEHRRVF